MVSPSRRQPNILGLRQSSQVWFRKIVLAAWWQE
jgi:hypothetical protein